MQARASGLLLLAALLAGCASGPTLPGGPTGQSTLVITDPRNYTDLEDPDARPHVHDYWGGEYMVEVLEAGADVWYRLDSQQRSASLAPEGKTVYPGTRWVNVSASVRKSEGFDGFVNLHVRLASEEQLSARVSDSGFSWTIPTDENRTDLPHALVSAWRFDLAIEGESAVSQGSIHVDLSVTIARPPGPLPIAPPHRTWWNGSTILVLHSERGELHDLFGESPPGLETSTPPLVIGRFNGVPVVPWKTKDVTYRLDYNSSTREEFHYDSKLAWKTADLTHHGDSQAPTRKVRAATGFFEWIIPTKDANWDSPYGDSTRWQFVLRPRGEPGTDSYAVDDKTRYMEGDYRLSIVANRAAET